MQTIAISLITYNSHEATIACLKSLEKIKKNDSNLHVYVIDNASKEPFVYPHQPQNFELTILHQKINSGFSGGHTIGIAHALKEKAEYILILNNDTIVDPMMLTSLWEVLEKDQTLAGSVPKIYFAKGHEFHKDRYSPSEQGKVFWYAGGKMDWNNVVGSHRGVDQVDQGQYDKDEIVDLLTGCCVLLRSEVLKTVGTFDARYFLYYEDADLHERIKRAGYSVMYVPSAVLWHSNAGSTGGSGSVLQDYFISRNRMLFGMTYAPFRTKVALFRESLRLLKSGRQWQKIGIKDYYMRKFGKGSFGV